MSRSLRRTLARIGRWPRLLAAATCLLLALGSALGADRTAASNGADGPSVPVVVAAKALPAGHTLARRDLAVARWPARIVPAGARGDPRRLVGQRLAGALVTREAVTQGRVVGKALADGLDGDTVATPVDLDSDVGMFVRAGDRVDLVATTGSSSDGLERTGETHRASGRSGTLVAQRLLVLAVYRAGDSVPPASALVLATTRDLALRIAGLRAGQSFTIVTEPP